MQTVKLQIFARYGTKEKILVPITEGQETGILSELEAMFGGRWLLVDRIYIGEGLLFTDGQTYKGFHPDFARYTDAVAPVFPADIPKGVIQIVRGIDLSSNTKKQ